MNKRKVKTIFIAAAASVFVAALSFNTTVSYLTDHEAAYNAISVGNVSVQIDEGEYSDPSDPIQAGTTLPKAPKLINNGKNDEYVFIRVAIPKANVTLLYDKDVTTEGGNPVTHKEGTKVGDKGSYELFRTIANGVKKTENENEVNIATGTPVTESTNKTPGFSPAIDINYNKHASGQEGWVYLNTAVESTQIDGVNYDCYYFGYNKRLAAVSGNAPKNKTINLFDSIQLKSFIDEEAMTISDGNKIDGTYKVKIDAYAVQADELGIDGLPTGENLLTDEQVSDVFNIIKNKQGGGMP